MAKNKLEFLTRDNSRFSDEAIKRIEKAFNVHEENYKKTKLKMFNNIHDFIPVSNEYRSYSKDLLNLNIDTDFDNWLNLTVGKFQGLETYLGDAWQDPFGN
jgi:capsule polysaccharide export protein KpsE/RkpR